MKTFIRWSGNKSQYIKYIVPHLPKTYNVYIEPFLGSGALFLYLMPKQYIVSDVNGDLISIWNGIKTKLSHIKAYIQDFKEKFINMNNEARVQMCKDMTLQLETLKPSIKRAVIFLLMKYCSYMGNIMVNGKYKFLGLELNIYRSKNQVYFLSDRYLTLLENVSEYLNNPETTTTIAHQDYKQCLKKARKGDFVFLDPPYIENHDYQFTYNRQGQVSNEFVLELQKELEKLDRRGVKWLMTQADTKEVRYMFKKYKCIEYQVFRGYSNTYKTELIIKNY